MDTASWYVLLTSASGHTVYSTRGPYGSRELADAKAIETKADHYRVSESSPPEARIWSRVTTPSPDA
jgi:hypothetical protein